MSERRLLVVDDDPEIIELVSTAFQGREIETETATSAEAALNRISRRVPDAILLDVRLPEMNGLEMCRTLKERGIDVPIILTSSYTTMDITISAMQEGAHDYLDKPLRLSTLVPLIERVLQPEEEPLSTLEISPGESADVSPALVGRSPAMVEVYKAIGRVARANTTILISGESGTGKELVARIVHRRSPRNGAPFQAVNCAAIPETLLESELFGHEKGAFTGAYRQKAGQFEQAGEGTIFLDEIAELPLSLQPKLLRALEERQVGRLGGNETVTLRARVVAATNRDPEEAVEQGDLREDLYYRLAVVRVRVPPLRDRDGDIRLLVDHFVRELAPQIGRSVERIADETYRLLADYAWPGNVRELRNVIERSLILGRGSTLLPRDLPELRSPTRRRPGSHTLGQMVEERRSLKEVEKRYIDGVLRETGGNRTRAAEILGIHRSTLRRKIDTYELEIPSGD